MRDSLPLKTLGVNYIKLLGIEPDKLKHSTKSQVFEDNVGALLVDKCPRVTPFGKLVAGKYHWFRDNIHNGECMVGKIGGDSQKADIFTKGLQAKLLLKNRNLLCGWYS